MRGAGAICQVDNMILVGGSNNLIDIFVGTVRMATLIGKWYWKFDVFYFLRLTLLSTDWNFICLAIKVIFNIEN